jgi:serine/threonine protein kinase
MALLHPDQMIRDTYEVERFLGEGAFAEVYRVRHRFLGRQAMKVFKKSGSSLSEIEQLLGEAILLSRIGHPNIVRVYDANLVESEHGTFGYFTMEHVPGGSLDKFWRSHGANLVPFPTALDLARQICRGLAQAHQENPPIVHRDIKPQNILIGYEADGLRARVSDFGLARQVNPLTLLASAAGTLSFKPPEVFHSTHADSCAADVWAIGTTLYLLLTDRLPFSTPKDADWNTHRSFDTPPVPPSEINPDADSAMDAIVLRALEKDPAHRFANAQAFLEALDAWRAPAPALQSKTLPGDASKSLPRLPPTHTPGQAQGSEALVARALAAKKLGRLNEAADLMEEAFSIDGQTREKFAAQVRLWRCGISM